MSQSAGQVLSQPLPQPSKILYIPVIGFAQEVKILYDIAKIRASFNRPEISSTSFAAVSKRIKLLDLNFEINNRGAVRNVFSLAIAVGCTALGFFSLTLGSITAVVSIGFLLARFFIVDRTLQKNHAHEKSLLGGSF
jgi:hypothetical protein